MASKIQTENPYGGPPPASTSKIISLWWPVGVLIGWMASFITGVALIYSFRSDQDCSFYRDGTSDCSPNATFYAGIAFVILAVVLKLVFWILIIVRCYQRRRGYQSVTTVVEHGNGGYNGQAGQQGVPLNQYSGGQQQEYYAPHSSQNTGYQSHVYQDAPIPARYG